jgi:Domain of unknown function DUF488
MLLDRQKRLLALLDALGGNVRGLDFQKLLLLYCLEVNVGSPYEFVPYRFGGFSFTAYSDKRRLIERGLLLDEERVWRLTDPGRAASVVALPVKRQMEDFARRHASLRGDALVAEAYRRHPYYAIQSEMAERLLAKDAVILAAVKAAQPAKGKPGVCTIGYEGRSLEGYLNELIQDGVTLLCDVRRNPLSRKYGFSKATLATGCQGVGIRYEHLPELGIPSEHRRRLGSQADYDTLFARYAREILPRQTEALVKIRRWVIEGERVALTCFERLPQHCHRRCVADALESKFGSMFAPRHLLGEGVMSRERILITVKTYPTLSRKYGETVCTAGIREDGSWARIYPVPFRRLDEAEQYRKFDWLECSLVMNRSDPRPESRKPVDPKELRPVGHIDTANNWRERRRLLLQTAKVYTRLQVLIDGAKANKFSARQQNLWVNSGSGRAPSA